MKTKPKLNNNKNPFSQHPNAKLSSKIKKKKNNGDHNVLVQQMLNKQDKTRNWSLISIISIYIKDSKLECKNFNKFRFTSAIRGIYGTFLWDMLNTLQTQLYPFYIP